MSINLFAVSYIQHILAAVPVSRTYKEVVFDAHYCGDFLIGIGVGIYKCLQSEYGHVLKPGLVLPVHPCQIVVDVSDGIDKGGLAYDYIDAPCAFHHFHSIGLDDGQRHYIICGIVQFVKAGKFKGQSLAGYA